MKESVPRRPRTRTALLLISVAFRADPRTAIVAIVTEGASLSLLPLTGLWLKLVVDGTIANQGGPVVAGAIGLAATAPIAALASGIGQRMRITLREKAGFALEKRYVESISSLAGLAHHEDPRFRDKLELLRQDKHLLGDAVNSIVYLMVTTLQVVATSLVIASAAPWLLLVGAGGIPSVVANGIADRLARKVEEDVAPLLRKGRYLHRLSVDSAASKEIRVTGVATELRALHDETWLEVHNTVAPMRWRIARLRIGAMTVFSAGLAGAGVYVALQALGGYASAGDLVLTLVIAGQVNRLVQSVSAQLQWVRKTMRTAERFSWLMDYVAREASGGGGGPATDARAVPRATRDGVQFERVGFRYPGTDVTVLSDLSFRIPAGSVVGLVGENGAGKSTLVNLLCRFYDVNEGRVLVDGVDVRQLAAH
jgi:ATP-binding cassette, subfamily B, bacterial